MGYKWGMPWKEESMMDQRVKLIGDYVSGDWSVSELAVEHGISRKTIYKWVERYEAGGAAALADRSHAARSHPNRVAPETERQVLELKAARPLWGAPKLRARLLKMAAVEACPAESTISEILRRHGLSQKARRRAKATPSLGPLSHCLGANDVWCADFKGLFHTQDGQKCSPLTITDGHSRYLLKCQGMAGATGFPTVRPLFIQVFREFGLPEAMRTDNGAPFASIGLGGLSKLSVWWIRVGIRPERIEPGRPDQNGRHERMHRTLKEAAASPPQASLAAQQKAFAEFQREYNEERPHEALGQRTPAEYYQPSARAYSERLPEQMGYPLGWEKRMVSPGGQVKWKGEQLHVTQALHGQEIGFQEVGERLWAVFFETIHLGFFEENKMRMTPLKAWIKNAQKEKNV